MLPHWYVLNLLGVEDLLDPVVVPGGYDEIELPRELLDQGAKKFAWNGVLMATQIFLTFGGSTGAAPGD